MGYIANIFKSRNKSFRFTFTSTEKGTHVFKYNPIEHEETEYSLVREDKGSIMFTFSGEYSYIKDSYTYLQGGLDTYGILWNCYLTIEKINNYTQEYETLVSLKKLDFSSIINEDSTNGLVLKVPLTDSGFYETIKAREDIEIPYSRLETLDGDTITPFANEYEDVTVYGVEIESANILSFTPYVYDLLSTRIYFPPLTSSNLQTCWIETAGASGTSHISYTDYTVDTDEFIESVMFFDGNGLSGNIRGSISLTYLTGGAWNTTVVLADYKTLTPVVISTETGYCDGIISDTVTINFDYDYDNDSRIAIFIYLTTSGSFTTWEFFGTDNNLYLNDKKTEQEIKHVSAMQVHKRILHAITGQEDCFVSSPFDTGGKWEHIYFSNGYLYRGFPETPTVPAIDGEITAQLTFKWKELQDNMRKYFNVEYGLIEVGGVKKIICEDKSYFYNTSLGHEITQIKRNSFIRELDIDLFYTSIRVGTPKKDYEETGALKSYANLCEYSTVLKTFKNELDLETTYFVDPIWAESARRLPKTETETTDSPYDNDIFMLETIVDGADLIQRTDEDFSSVTGIPEITTPMNLNLPPARCLNRHGEWIGIGLQKYLDDNIVFTNSEIKNTLATVRSDESITVSENVDINPGDFNQPYLSGYKVKVLADVTFEKITAIESDPYKLIQVPNPFSVGSGTFYLNQISNKPIGESLSNIEGHESTIPPEPTAEYWLWLDSQPITWQDNNGIELLQ